MKKIKLFLNQYLSTLFFIILPFITVFTIFFCVSCEFFNQQTTVDVCVDEALDQLIVEDEADHSYQKHDPAPKK